MKYLVWFLFVLFFSCSAAPGKGTTSKNGSTIAVAKKKIVSMDTEKIEATALDVAATPDTDSASVLAAVGDTDSVSELVAASDSVSNSTMSAREKKSICGILTSSGYPALSFIVPESIRSKQVKRYEVVDENVFPPLEVSDGWWVCVTEGYIVEEPEDDDIDSYGKIFVRDIESVQTNGEKGQE